MSQPKPPPLSSLPPDYVRSYTGDLLRDVTISFTVIEIVFIGLRYLSKLIGKNPFGIDDWLMIPALVFCLAQNAVAFVGINYGGVGYHMVVLEDTAPHKLIIWAKVLVATPILYSVAVCLPKLAILVLYLRVFVTKFQRMTTYVLMGVVIAVAAADIIAAGLQCQPIAFLWDKTIPGGHCYNIPAFYRYGTLPNSITDLLMLLLPVPVVLKLKTSIRIKAGLMLTFAAGSVGLIASILRTVAFFQHNPLVDGTRSSVIFLYWSVVEPGCYLIAACLVCLRPLLNLFMGKDPDHNSTHKSRSFRSRFTALSKKSGNGNSQGTVASLVERPSPVAQPHPRAASHPSVGSGLESGEEEKMHEKSDEESLVGL